MEFKLDTEAKANVLPSSGYKKIHTVKKLSESNITLVSYENFQLKSEGELILK